MYAETRQGKRITVYVSGDKFMRGKVITVNTHDLPVFERLCSYLTERVPHPTGGCYRRIYTPDGTEVRALEQIQSGNEYVAAKDKYRKAAKDLRYTDIKDERRREFRKAASSEAKRYTPVQHQHDPRLRNLHGRAKSLGEQKKAVILKVFVNGEFTEHARTVVITEPHNRSLKYVKEYIQDTLGTSEIRELHKVINGGGIAENFQLLTENDVSSLKSNDHILAVQNIRHLTPKRYNEKGCRNFSVHTSPRTGQASLYDPFPMPHSPPRSKGQFSKHKKLPQIGSSNQSQADTMSPYSNAPSHGGRRSDKSKGSRNHRDYDTDEGGVFKAKKQNNAQGAHQERVNEDAAAAKIQAGARAYKARKEYQAKKQAKQQDEEARRREQDALRQQEDERREEEERRKAESMSKKKQMDEDKAATKIQASFKGHKARKDFKARQATKQQVCHDKQSKNAKEIEAATKIQSGFRGFKARQDYNNRKKQAKVTDINDNENKGIVNDMAGKKKLNQDEAAVVIQAGYKGYRTRREIAQRKAQEKNEKIEETVDNKSDNDKKQHTAATQIQANFRGFKARKDYTEKKQKAREENDKKEKARVEKESATKIQASFRGFKTRKEVAEKKKKEPQLPDQAPSPRGKDAEDLDKAATKIQAGFKGFKARKEYNAKGQQ